MRRAVTVLIAGLIVVLALLPFAPWGMALVVGWDAAALTFLLATWPIIIRADGSRAAQLAAREDDTDGSARALLVAASVASLLGVGYALILAGRSSGAGRVLLIGGDVLGQERPGYRDFAYVAFTIGMTYQVSDTTLRDPRIRRSVLAHAILSYLFGVVIVAGSVNLISGLVRGY